MKATKLDISRRELLTGAAAISAAAVLPALPAIAEDAIYVSPQPYLAPGSRIVTLRVTDHFGVTLESRQIVPIDDREYTLVAGFDAQKNVTSVELVEVR